MSSKAMEAAVRQISVLVDGVGDNLVVIPFNGLLVEPKFSL